MGKTIARDKWTFASGRAAALEARMLPRSFFERLAELSGPEEIIHNLGETPLSGQLARPEELREAHLKARAFRDGAFEEMRRYSPSTGLADLMELQKEFRSLKNFVKKHDLGLDVAPVASRYGEEVWERLWAGQEVNVPVYFQTAAQRIKAIVGPKATQAAFLDAACDSACLAALCEAAQMTGSDFIVEHYSRYDTVKGIEMLWRAKMGGLGDEVLHVLTEGRQDAALFGAIRKSDEAEWPEMLASALRGLSVERVAGAKDLDRVREFVAAADEWQMSFVRQARLVPYGIERVFGYLLGIDAEAANLALCLCGRAYGIAPELLLRRLRACYV